MVCFTKRANLHKLLLLRLVLPPHAGPNGRQAKQKRITGVTLVTNWQFARLEYGTWAVIYRGWHLSGSVLVHMEAVQASDAAAQDVERGNGYLLEPFLLLLERPALVSHALLGLLDLRLDLAAALLDLAGHLQHVLEATLDLLRHVCTEEWIGLSNAKNIPIKVCTLFSLSIYTHNIVKWRTCTSISR